MTAPAVGSTQNALWQLNRAIRIWEEDRCEDLPPSFGHYAEDGKTYLICGLIPKEEFYDRYSAASGLSVDQKKLEFYRILNCFQIIASAGATATRVAALGKSHQDVLLTRVKGMECVTGLELARLLKDKI